MKRKGQFYLVTVVVLVAVFLGVLTINNSIKKSSNPSIYDLETEIRIERGKTLDYIANNNFNSANSMIIMTNFSNLYMEKVGLNKNIIFIVGDSSNIRLIGNVNSGFINYTSGSLLGTFEDGTFQEDFTPQGNKIFINLNNREFSYDVNFGQNIYYIIEHIYNEEVYLIKN